MIKEKRACTSDGRSCWPAVEVGRGNVECSIRRAIWNLYSRPRGPSVLSDSARVRTHRFGLPTLATYLSDARYRFHLMNTTVASLAYDSHFGPPSEPLNIEDFITDGRKPLSSSEENLFTSKPCHIQNRDALETLTEDQRKEIQDECWYAVDPPLDMGRT